MADTRSWLYASWTLFFVVWTLWGLSAKKAVRRQSRTSRIKQAIVLILSFWMLFSPASGVGPLSLRILNHSPLTEFVAVLFHILGFGIAIWARFHLGRNWSATVTVKENHGLIQTGPYAVVRHPIYSGISLAALGLAILNGDLRSFLGFAVMLVGWRIKFQLEEEFMTDQFGETYRDYKHRVNAIIPFVW